MHKGINTVDSILRGGGETQTVQIRVEKIQNGYTVEYWSAKDKKWLTQYMKTAEELLQYINTKPAGK